MWGVRGVVLVAAVGVISGCAGGRTRQDVARLQSQVGLLEERMSQIERGGMGSAAAALPSEMAAWSSPTVSGAGATKNPSGGSQAPSTASGKPSTRKIQQALKNSGFYQGSLDGKMGSKTHDAIKEFQRVHGLQDDGVVGKQTWAKLRSYLDLSATNANAVTALK